MALIDYFRPKNEKKPVVRGFSFRGNILTYDLSYDVYFKYYNLNPFVFSCINKRAKDSFSKWYQLVKGNNKTTYNEEFEDLIKYSTSWNAKEFLERLSRDYDITWNAYIYIVKDEGWKKPIWIQILDPRYVKPVSDQYWQLLWYVQNLNWVRTYLKDEIFHLKDDNDIDNEVVGKSRMTSLFIDIESDQEARDSNLAFFKNNQTPSSIVLIDPEFELDDDNEKAIREKIKEMFEWWKYVGGKNKHRSMMAQGIKDIVKVQDKISDWEFLELRKFTLDIVSAIYEVPKSILWFTDSVNYANWLTQYDIYWDNIEAKDEKFAEFLTDVLQVFDDRYRFEWLKDNLRKLQIKSEIAWNLYKDKGLITLNEWREIIQYDKVYDWDKFADLKNTDTNITQK